MFGKKLGTLLELVISNIRFLMFEKIYQWKVRGQNPIVAYNVIGVISAQIATLIETEFIGSACV